MPEYREGAQTARARAARRACALRATFLHSPLAPRATRSDPRVCVCICLYISGNALFAATTLLSRYIVVLISDERATLVYNDSAGELLAFWNDEIALLARKLYSCFFNK